MTGIVFDIKEFSVFDGPGIRTTIFMKGCPLRCMWCHNPEGLSPAPQMMVSRAVCTDCGACKRICPSPENCVVCGACVSACRGGFRRIVGERWEAEALDGDHYRLAFDQPGTWSIKYNLVWDRLLDLGLFSEEVTRMELAYYKTKCNAYGLPLDSRSDYTKSDWQLWATALAEDPAFTELIVDRMWDFLRESPDRVPFCDWYFTSHPKIRGFQARSVQGGLFIKLLTL